jgi:hypothetical protein
LRQIQPLRYTCKSGVTCVRNAGDTHSPGGERGSPVGERADSRKIWLRIYLSTSRMNQGHTRGKFASITWQIRAKSRELRRYQRLSGGGGGRRGTLASP